MFFIVLALLQLTGFEMKQWNDSKVKVLTFSFKGVRLDEQFRICSHFFFTFRGLCIKKRASISIWLIKRGCKHNPMKAESQHFNLTAIASLHIQCVGVQSRNKSALTLTHCSVCYHYFILTKWSYGTNCSSLYDTAVYWHHGRGSYFPRSTHSERKLRVQGKKHNKRAITLTNTAMRDKTL